MKRTALFTALFLFAIFITVARAADFSLQGARLGMPRAELDRVWQKLDNGGYAIDGSILMNLKPEFDHRDRLYRLTFAFPLPLQDQYPPAMVATAFQEQLTGMWQQDNITVTVRTGRGTAEVVVTDKALLQELTEHVKAQVQFQLGQILKP